MPDSYRSVVTWKLVEVVGLSFRGEWMDQWTSIASGRTIWLDLVISMESSGCMGLSKIHRLIGEDVNIKLLAEYQQFGGAIENSTYEPFKVLRPSTGYQLSFTQIFSSGTNNHSESLTRDHNVQHEIFYL